HPLREVGLLVAEGVRLARQDQHVEPLVRPDQGINQPDRVRRVHVVVHVPVNEQQVPLQVGRQLGVRRYLDLELHLRRLVLLGFGLFLILIAFVLLGFGLFLVLLTLILFGFGLLLVLLGLVFLGLGLLFVLLAFVLLHFGLFHVLGRVVLLGLGLLVLRIAFL